jgi:hypothetical protein
MLGATMNLQSIGKRSILALANFRIHIFCPGLGNLDTEVGN